MTGTLPLHRALIALASLLVSPLALAQGTPPPDAAGGACRADIAALCPGIQPGPGTHRAIAQCLASQQDKLSAPCKAHVDQVKARIEAARQACQPDVEKYCADVAPGGGRVLQCLRQHQAELSEACQAQRAKQHRPQPSPTPAAPQP